MLALGGGGVMIGLYLAGGLVTSACPRLENLRNTLDSGRPGPSHTAMHDPTPKDRKFGRVRAP